MSKYGLSLSAKIHQVKTELNVTDAAATFLSKTYKFSGALCDSLHMLRRFEDDNDKTADGNVKGIWRINSEEWSLITPLGKKMRLTGKEHHFINCLALAPKRIVSRDSLKQSLEYTQNESGDRSLEAIVYRLRKKISPTLDTPIKTANGSGYAFTSALEMDG